MLPGVGRRGGINSTKSLVIIDQVCVEFKRVAILWRKQLGVHERGVFHQ